VVVDAKVKENREDHSSEWKERSAQKRFDRADIVRDTNMSALLQVQLVFRRETAENFPRSDQIELET